MDKNAKIYISNHAAMIGSAIMRRFVKNGFNNLVIRTAVELDLTNQKAVFDFFKEEMPEYAILTSIKMGGILANTQYPGEFIYQNIQSQNNVIQAAWQTGVKKLLYLGSSCIYPRECPQPIIEEYLLSGKLETTCTPYAVAKIAGIALCQSYYRQYGANFITAVPADAYGPEDDFDLVSAHFLPALMRRIHEATVEDQDNVIIWGSGLPRRECLHVNDLADAVIFLMNEYNSAELINIGSGNDFSIKELALLLATIIGFNGKMLFDNSKPDGVPQKLLDNSKIRKLGWSPKISAEEGVRQTYQWYLEHLAK